MSLKKLHLAFPDCIGFRCRKSRHVTTLQYETLSQLVD